jgi:hypothetical protein
VLDDAKAVDLQGVFTVYALGREHGYEKQLPLEVIPQLDPKGIAVFRILAQNLMRDDPLYRCAAHLWFTKQLKVDLGDDALTLGLGEALTVDVPVYLYDSWHSVTEVLNQGAKLIASPQYLQRFPDKPTEGENHDA